jgi:MoaA/NifB/PqqE/SkfB family radical SAM enzyme
MIDGETGGAVPVSLTRRRDGRPLELDGAATACLAPTRNLQFLPDGSIRACSQSLWPLGKVQTDQLEEVWAGARRAELAARLAAGDMSRGCETCGAEFRTAGRANSFAAQFDRLDGRGDAAWPARLEFSLSEECNLECVHCYGAIQELRRHVPDSSKFGDRFLRDLEPFLVHATEAVFGGGEPFVIEANYRVWDLIAATVPDLPCTIVTNGTQWTSRIEELLDRLRVGFVVSVDGATATTFESIRVNASWQEVRANLERFRSHVDRHGTWMSINFVLMAQNHHELGLMAELADDLDVDLTVAIARHPADCAIGQQDAHRRRAMAEDLREQLHRHGPRLERNRAALERAVTEAVATCDTHVDQDELVRDLHRILLFGRTGDGPHDDLGTRAELAALAVDGEVHEVRVGPGDEVTAISPVVAAWRDDLVGRPAEHLQQVLNEQLGQPIDQQVIAQNDDRMDLESTHPGGVVRTSLVAVRDDNGILVEVRILFCRTMPTP